MSPIEKLIARFEPSPGEENRIDASISNFNLRVKTQENERHSAAAENMDEVADVEVADENELNVIHLNKEIPRFKEEAKSPESADMKLTIEA